MGVQDDLFLIRKFTLNILTKDKSKTSLVNKRLKAARNWAYQMNLLLLYVRPEFHFQR